MPVAGPSGQSPYRPALSPGRSVSRAWSKELNSTQRLESPPLARSHAGSPRASLPPAVLEDCARAVEVATAGLTYERVATELGYANRATVHRLVARTAA